jgi:predicted component of type VI protein secretion system
MDIRLVIRTGKHAGKAVRVARDKFFIGRSPKCHLTITNSAVSRHHCAILVGKGVVAVHELGSRTGTFVNGEKIEKQTRLRSGDKVRVGPFEFEVRLPSQPAPGVKPASEPAAAAPGATSDDDVLRWLAQAPTGPAAPPELAEQTPSESEESEEEDEGPTDFSEEDKEERRVSGDIVGVSKSRQAMRTSDTSRNAAADAMKRFFGGGGGEQWPE